MTHIIQCALATLPQELKELKALAQRPRRIGCSGLRTISEAIDAILEARK